MFIISAKKEETVQFMLILSAKKGNEGEMYFYAPVYCQSKHIKMAPTR